MNFYHLACLQEGRTEVLRRITQRTDEDLAATIVGARSKAQVDCDRLKRPGPG